MRSNEKVSARTVLVYLFVFPFFLASILAIQTLVCTQDLEGVKIGVHIDREVAGGMPTEYLSTGIRLREQRRAVLSWDSPAVSGMEGVDVIREKR